MQAASSDTLEAVHIQISGWDSLPGYTEYAIITTIRDGWKAREFHSRHRFSDFLQLHVALCKQLPLPATFPAPKLWAHTDSATRERMVRLESYLNVAVALCGMSLTEVLRGFLNAFEVVNVAPIVGGFFDTACEMALHLSDYPLSPSTEIKWSPGGLQLLEGHACAVVEI